MTDTNHILLASEGADKFKKEKGLEIVPNYYFFTPKNIK